MKRSHLLAIVSFTFVVLIYLFLSFRCSGHDWKDAEGNAEVISVSNLQPATFPVFSYIYNGGAYLFQDPQTFLTSAVSQFIVRAAGPASGLRWFLVLFAAIGWFSLFAWLKPKLGETAAAVSATVWCLSLCFFWRGVAGHVPYFVHFTLPLFLILFERIFDGKNLPLSIPLLGVLGAWVGYEPSFHSFFYLIIPIGLIWVSILTVHRETGQVRAMMGISASIAIALLILAPRWISWLHLPMTRSPDPLDGTLRLRDVLYGLFATARAGVMHFGVPGSSFNERLDYIWEVNVALFPPATFLAAIGLGVFFKDLGKKKSALILAVFCVAFGVVIATDQMLWRSIQSLTSSGIRVPSRFLGAAAFGLAVLAGYGFQFLAKKFPRYETWIAASVILATVAFSADWIRRAEKQGTLLKESIPWMQSVAIQKAPGQVWLGRYCGVGTGCPNLDSPDYASDPYRMHIAAKAAGLGLKNAEVLPTLLPVLLDDPLDHSEVFVDHREVRVRPAADRGVIGLLLKKTVLGEEVVVEPEGVSVQVAAKDGHLLLTIPTPGSVREIRIRPKIPFPTWSGWVAALSLMFCGIWIAFLRVINP